MFSRRLFLQRAGISPLALVVPVAVIPASLLVEGCNGTSVAQDIVNWTPTLESTVATVASTMEILLPQYALLIGVAETAFIAGANLVMSEAKAYLANPGQTTLQALQTAVITLQQQLSTALLNAAKIVDPKSQTTITNALNAAATAVNAILSLISSIKGNTVSQTASQLKAQNKLVRLYQLPRSFDMAQTSAIIAEHYQIPMYQARLMFIGSFNQLSSKGF